MINDISENKLMESFYNMIPYFKYFFNSELGFTISNTEKFLLVQNSEKIKIDCKKGDAVPEGSAADLCLKKKEVIHTIIPKEVFGIPVETIGIPVFVDNNIEGTLIVSMSVDNTVRKAKITNLSNALSESLSQISSRSVEMADRFQKISETNMNIEGFIKDTKNNSEKTDEVLSFIHNIAKQTNLLGLNAAIESARAGEYGRGFEVVSSEIRKLSNSTKDSISQIDEILDNIQNSISDIYEKFQNSNVLLESQTSSLQEITANIEELTANAALLKEFADEI